MSICVVDTDVVSYGFRGDSRFTFFEPHLLGKDAFISFMTTAELDYWGLSRNWGKRRRQQLDAYVDQHYAMYPVTRQLCKLWSEVTFEAKQQGRVIRGADAWIAATAIRLNAPLLTNNRKDFEFLSTLQLVSPMIH